MENNVFNKLLKTIFVLLKKLFFEQTFEKTIATENQFFEPTMLLN